MAERTVKGYCLKESAPASLTRQSSTAMRLNISGLARMHGRTEILPGEMDISNGLLVNLRFPLKIVPCATEISFFEHLSSNLFAAGPFTAR